MSCLCRVCTNSIVVDSAVLFLLLPRLPEIKEGFESKNEFRFDLDYPLVGEAYWARRPG